MSSTDWPFSSFFSISISSLIPSTTICTSSTSEKPSLSALEMSKTPPTAAVSTPPGGKNANKNIIHRPMFSRLLDEVLIVVYINVHPTFWGKMLSLILN
uniref:Uncharacterized protein n=2 Tax=Seriola TaxID=8160 RepID=A0A3B4XQT3_SERLL